jgi:hypothetical protein
MDGARADVKRGDFRSARQILPQIQQAGGDTGSLAQEINDAEQARFSQLDASFNQLKARSDESSVQSLKDLQAQFQALADGGGPTANDARRDAAGIPDAIGGVQAHMASLKEDAAYMQAVQAYRASPNEASALETFRSNFQSIVKGGGRHAAEAQKIADEISARVIALNAVASAMATPPVVRDETPAVFAAVKQYSDAYEQRNADALRLVWPAMTAQVYGRLKTSFGAASSIHLQLANEKVDLGADGASAVVNADITQQYTPKGDKTQTRTDHTVFHLVKTNGKWVIRDLQ